MSANAIPVTTIHPTEALWREVAPLIPPAPPTDKGGRPRVDDRRCLAGILFVLRTGSSWDMIPRGVGYASGATCWRRLREWSAAGVWQSLLPPIRTHLGRQAVVAWAWDERGDPTARTLYGGRTRGQVRRTVRAILGDLAARSPGPAGVRGIGA